MTKLPSAQFRALIDEIKHRVSILDIAEDGGIGLRQEGSCYKGLCPFHDDSATASFAIYPEQGRWRCFGACQESGDALNLYMKLHGVKFREAVDELAGRCGITIPSSEGPTVAPPRKNAKKTTARPKYETPPPPKCPVDLEDLDHLWPYDRAESVYSYPIVGGGVAHEVRYLKDGKKRSALTRPTEWGLVYGLREGEYYRKGTCWRQVNDKTPGGAERKFIAEAKVGLYRPDVFRQARQGEEWILLVEGPKDADAAIELGLYATSSAGGASGLKDYQAEELRGHLVAVVGDHDDAGKKGAEMRARLLRKVAREVRVLPPLGGAPGSGFDLTDFADEKRQAGLQGEGIAQVLLELVATAQPSFARGPKEKTTIPVTTDEEDVNDAALDAVARHASNLYQRCGSLVHVVRAHPEEDQDEEIHRAAGSPTIRIMPEPVLRQVLSEHCRFVKVRYLEDDRSEEKAVHPPQWTTRNLLARGEWDSVPILQTVVEGPVMRRDGSLLQEPGYDKTSGILYVPNTKYDSVPDRPSRRDVEAALELLREVVCDFPFESEEHFSAWLSALLTPLARFTFKGPSPLNLIDANVRGAGKSLLADVSNMIITGRPAARMSYDSRDEAELRKAITCIAINGDQIVLIDNVRGYLGDATLDRALTATTWKDRLLGSNVSVELPLDVTWYATGNNVTLTADTARRVLHIRLESPEERPEDRTEFRHPNLMVWIAQERRRILPAALTLLRAWWVAGRTQHKLGGFGSFEGWSATVRQCVVWLGLPDPVKTRAALNEAADLEAAALRSLVSGLEEILRAPHLLGQATTGEILSILETSTSEDEYLALKQALGELIPRLKTGQLPTSRQLGYLLRQHRGKWIDGACLTAAKEKTKRGIAWIVRRRAGDDGDDDSSWHFSRDSTASSPSPPKTSESGPKGDDGDYGDDPDSLRGNDLEEVDELERRFFRRSVGSSPSAPSSPTEIDDDPDSEDPSSDDRPPF